MEKQNIQMEIEHFSHNHRLNLCRMDDRGEPCNGCSRPIFDLGYTCFECGFLLHKNCTKLPRNVVHRLHPKHHLTLLFNSWETFKCSVCKKTRSGFAFQCRECLYIMDVNCFLRYWHYLDLPPPEEKMKTLQHFSHNHTVTLCYLTKQSKKNCRGCEMPISGPAYCCKECDQIALHKSCAQLSQQTQNPFHLSHTLRLFVESPYPFSGTICDACRKVIRGFVYHCDKCYFDLDLLCACLTPSLDYEKHNHRLTFFKEIYGQVSCNVCGKLCSDNLYRCVNCNFNVHSTCIFPSSVNHKHHPHPLTLEDSAPRQCSSRILCAACEKNISPRARAYYCGQCSYGVHLECVVSEVNSATPIPQIYTKQS